MKVQILADPKGPHFARIRQVVISVNGVQKYFRLSLLANERVLAEGGCLVSPREFCQTLQVRYPDSHSIAVVDQPFDDNWFSHEFRSGSVITTDDWEQQYAPPSLRAYLVYEIAQSLLTFAADLSEEVSLQHLVHEPPQGCMFDMCDNKSDIRLGMVAGHLCPICVGKLRRFGVTDEPINAIKRILTLVRSEAIGQPFVWDPSTAFVVMRFTTNDENDNAWKYGIKPGLQRVGLLPNRADSRVESGQILDKIYNQICRSRFVVAKVDESNLNVYFELGLAMGLEKEVLLISESSLVINLPSDLRNWECLTYEKGDYDYLANKVTRFFEDGYGLAAQL